MSPSLFDSLDHQSAIAVRDIDNSYQLTMIAQSSREIGQANAQILRSQAAHALQEKEQLSEISFELGHVIDSLENMGFDLEELVDISKRTEEGVKRVEAAVESVDKNICMLQHIVVDWFSCISEQMFEQQQTLNHIEDILRKPLETAVLEIRKKAEEALKNGMTVIGKEKHDWYRDAMNLLDSAVHNPIGEQDYVAWHQIGWLFWKDGNNLFEAEAAFERAARLSAPSSNLYYSSSLQHLAYVRYMQRDLEGAYEAINNARKVNTDVAVLFDAARYAAASGRHPAAIALLEECLGREPITVIKALSEVDFNAMTIPLYELVERLLEEAKAIALSSGNIWKLLLDAAQECEKIADCRIEICREHEISNRESLVGRINNADYLDACEIRYATNEACTGLRNVIMETLNGVLEVRKEEAVLARGELQSIESKIYQAKDNEVNRIDAIEKRKGEKESGILGESKAKHQELQDTGLGEGSNSGIIFGVVTPFVAVGLIILLGGSDDCGNKCCIGGSVWILLPLSIGWWAWYLISSGITRMRTSKELQMQAVICASEIGDVEEDLRLKLFDLEEEKEQAKTRLTLAKAQGLKVIEALKYFEKKLSSE